jgi:hypothetical protein
MLEKVIQLADHDAERRSDAAFTLFADGKARTSNWFDEWSKEEDFRVLVIQEHFMSPDGESVLCPKLTVGIAVRPETFQKIRAANGSPELADAPANQDVLEFELEYSSSFKPIARLDILTPNSPGGNGAIARFLEKFGEGIQQIEIGVTDVDRATELLRTRFNVEPIYPATRAGANGTRVNFFLVTPSDGKKVLVELVEHPKAIG